MIRRDFTSASIEFWKKHQAEKQAIQDTNFRKGLLMVTVLPIVFLILSFIFAGKAHADPAYDMIATAYVTTTISQVVVLSPAQKSAGNLTFSIQAHNGGGRPNQPDTASVQIQFYNSSNSLLYTAASSQYSLPIPNGIGQPGIDPTVPWTTMTVSSANCGSSCANVAYVKVIASGIDGSYWAGDYGPWYMAPTLTVNGGANILYNPEFGPYNGVSAQGWTISPALGACQGAWGGSNPCIANSAGQAGQNTTGLVANQNGGGPSASGGTTSAPAGGTVQAAPAPPAPTFSQLKFSGNQIADTQWNVGSCTNAGGTNCQIYSKSPGPTYNLGYPVYPSSTQYIAFTATNNSTDPWHMWLYNSDGSVAQDLGVGHILSQGTGSDGHHYFFFSNANYNGTLFSTDWGMNNNNGVTINGTNSPTVPQTDTFASTGSTTPLAAGASSGGGSSAPTVTGTSTSNSTSSSSTTTNDFQGVVVTDVTYINGTVSAFDTIVYGTDSRVTTTTTTTPVTTTTYSDGTTTSSNGTSSTSQTIVDTYNVWKTYEINKWSYTIPVVTGNSIYLNQSGSNPQVTIEQVGRNTLAGINNPNAYLVGNNNALIVRQAGNDNLTLVKASGTGNRIQVPQGYHHNWANGAEWPVSGSDNNIAMIDVLGNSNNVFVPQEGLRNLAVTSTAGNSNNPVIVQYGNDNRSYNSIVGDNNAIGNWQQGNGNLSSINITGNGNQASVTQNGNNNAAVITIVNAGGPSSVQATQTNMGTGPGNLLSIQQQCATPSGCSVTVNQTK